MLCQLLDDFLEVRLGESGLLAEQRLDHEVVERRYSVAPGRVHGVERQRLARLDTRERQLGDLGVGLGKGVQRKRVELGFAGRERARRARVEAGEPAAREVVDDLRLYGGERIGGRRRLGPQRAA